jgi:predicted nucleic acid-binding protein
MQYLFLDTNLLGQLCHPNPDKYAEIKVWAFQMLRNQAQNFELCIPEIADYELRRKLIHLSLKHGQKQTVSLQRLDAYQQILNFTPLTSETLKAAAKLWAEARFQGLPTAQPESLDGDVILAVQAREKKGVVLTTNKKHLSRFVPVADWQNYQF